MSLSNSAIDELSYIFSNLSIDWIYNRDCSPESFCKDKFKLYGEWTFESMSESINSFCQKHSKESPKECNKLKALLDFTSQQMEIWEQLSTEKKSSMMEKYNSDFPSILYKEVWSKNQLSNNEKPQKVNTLNKMQAKQELKEYFSQLNFFEKNFKDSILKTVIPPNLIEQKYSHTNFTIAEEKVLKLKNLLTPPLSNEVLTLSGNEKYVLHYLSNVESLIKQCSLFLDIVSEFKKQGKLLVLSQLSLDQEVFEHYSLMFYNQEITSNDKLQEILFEYITHNGIHYLDILLKLDLYNPNPEHQSFFLHSPFKLRAKNSKIIHLKTEGEAESIKTLKQGRVGNLQQNIKSTNPFGNKTNRQLSKYELIGRILKNIQIISLTYKTLQTMKVAENDMTTMKKIVDNLPTYSEEHLESLEAKKLFIISQDIFGAVATVRKLQQKYS